MNGLREAMERYLALRRSLGFKLRGPGGWLRSFVSFAEAEEASHITTALALRWATQPDKAQPSTKAERLACVRRFAAWHQATAAPSTEVPPEGLLPGRYERRQPYIYSDTEIESVISAATQLRSSNGMRGLTYSTYFGLLAATGMRVSEALALNEPDVDLCAGIITIQRTKFAKSRLVPVHASTRMVLAEYAEQKAQILSSVTTSAFFLSDRGTRLTEWSARRTFAKLSQQLGLRDPVVGDRHGRGPRLHDMRHRFAVRALIGAYRAGLDTECELPKIATYLGHAHHSDTYWYIEAVPELLQLATKRIMHRHSEEVSP